MIVYHGTTVDCLEGIQAHGLRPGSFVSATLDLAREYAWLRAMTLGADDMVIFELDIPDAAVLAVQSWWWAPNQLQVPLGCPATCIISLDRSNPRPASAGERGVPAPPDAEGLDEGRATQSPGQ